jgi:hypothetical protein
VGPVNFPGNVAGLIASEEDEDRGSLRGLRSASKDSLSAEFFYFLVRQRRGDKWGPDRARSYGANAYALLDCETGE